MSFIQITSSKELISVLEIFKNRLPKSAQIHNVLKTFLDKLFTRDGVDDAKFFKYDGLELSKTCFVSKSVYTPTVTNEKRNVWVILTAEVPSEQFEVFHTPIINALYNIIDKSIYNSFNGTQADLAPLIREKFKELSFFMYKPGIVLYMSPKNIKKSETISLKVNANEIVKVRQLLPEEVKLVLDCWKFSVYETCVEEFKTINAQLPSSCICVNEKPVSWAAQFLDGGIHAAFTLDEYRGRGFAKKMLSDLCEKIMSLDQVPVSHIEDGNAASVALHLSVGFEIIHEITWIEIEPYKHVK